MVSTENIKSRRSKVSLAVKTHTVIIRVTALCSQMISSTEVGSKWESYNSIS